MPTHRIRALLAMFTILLTAALFVFCFWQPEALPALIALMTPLSVIVAFYFSPAKE